MILDDLQNITEIKDPVEYEINGKTFYQDELNHKDDCAILDILYEKGISGFDDLLNKSLADVVTILFRQKVFAKIVCVLLKPLSDENPISESEVDSMKNSLIYKVILDFFGLNPGLSVLLQTLIVASDGTLTTSKSRPSSHTADSKTRESSAPQQNQQPTT